MSSSPDFSLLCPACGGQNAPDSKFCRHCGQPLEGALVAALPAPDTSADVPVGAPDELATTGGVLPAVASPVGVVPVETPVASVPAVVTAAAVANLEAAVLTSPGEIDARHARQLLERAQNLAERADVAGAILACRQAIALAPTVVGGQVMLGALLERSGDLVGALQALERANQVAPDGALSRDIARLREKTAPKPDAPVFHFNDAELFDDELLPSTTSETASTTAPTVAAVVATEIAGATVLAPPSVEAERANLDAAENITALPVSAIPAMESEGAEHLAPVVMTALPADGDTANGEVAEAKADGNHSTDAVRVDAPADAPTDASSNFNGLATAVTAVLPPMAERRVAVVPVRVERRINLTPGAFVSGAPQGTPMGTPIGARVQAPAANVNALSLGNIDSAPQGWNALWARPSFFGRSLPLVGATILSLGFLGWARGHADASNLANTPTIIVASAPTSETTAVNPAPAPAERASNLPPLAPVGSAAAPNGGFPITNQAVTVPPLAPSVAPPRTIQTTVTRVITAPPRRTPRVGTNPNFLPPAPIPAPGSRTNADGGGNAGGGLILPPPIITPPDTGSPAVSVLPPGSPPLNPAGSSGRGYVRITQGRVGSILPQRPSTRASDAERAAAAAARNGSPTQAIDGLTNAINANSSDAGFRFQQRAMLFLGQSDYARAADDFQSAITAYSDQIARGEQVASARAGLSAARSGLNRALAGGR